MIELMWWSVVDEMVVWIVVNDCGNGGQSCDWGRGGLNGQNVVI
jgi:hypothetical protein